jgi:hypothetical protein
MFNQEQSMLLLGMVEDKLRKTRLDYYQYMQANPVYVDLEYLDYLKNRLRNLREMAGKLRKAAS